MMDVCLLGCGGMMPLPDRFLTSLYVRVDGRAVLIDGGEGTQTAIRSASLRFKCIESVLITHFHADHVSGLPGLFLTLGNEGRTEPLTVYGPPGLKRVISALRVIVPELTYEIVCQELGGEGAEFETAGMNVKAFALDHGMPCYGYALSLPRAGKFDPVKAQALHVPLRLWSALQRGESAEGFTPEDVLGAPRRGIRVLYATDSRPVSAIARLGAQADLLVLEGMFGEPEKEARALKTHHMTMQEAARLAVEADAKRLWLTHFSPANPHPEEFLEEIQAIFPETTLGASGLMTTLRFENE